VADADRELTLKQTFQMLSGTLGSTPIRRALRGHRRHVHCRRRNYTGRVNGNTIQGSGAGGNWTPPMIR